jgi:ribose transport system ATP-binding protein
VTERLVVRGVGKAFGATQALSDVELSLQTGAVHAIIGENGAGKSTLMKILSGALRPDSGSLLLDGLSYAPQDPDAARRAGVAIVYQEAPLCPDMSVAENIVLGVEPVRYGLVDRIEMRARVERALAEVVAGDRDAPLRPNQRVAALSPSDRQLVAIARALAHSSCRVLILDEPTASLTADDVERLFSVIARLKQTGMSVLYISHFLEEVERIADSYTVLRDGRSVGSGRMADVTIAELVSSMAGRRVEQLFPHSERTRGELLLALDHVSGQKKPSDASLELYRGEALGIAGLLGSGRTELLRVLFGLEKVRSGRLRVGAFIGPASPTQRLAQGVGLLSEDRKSEGVAEALSIADNMTLSKLECLGSFGFVSPARQRRAAETWIERLGIRCRSPLQRAADLSGGNQQKLALARLLFHEVDVFLLDEPTRGIDVRSRAEVYRLIDELTVRGKAVLMVSSYLPELLGVCDRVAVMRRGRLGPARDASELDEHRALMEATSG